MEPAKCVITIFQVLKRNKHAFSPALTNKLKSFFKYAHANQGREKVLVDKQRDRVVITRQEQFQEKGEYPIHPN